MSPYAYDTYVNIYGCLQDCHALYISLPQPDRSTPIRGTICGRVALEATEIFSSAIVAYWSRAQGFSQVILPSMRLCSSGYFKGMMSPQWNSLITVLVPSLRRVAGGFTRCLAMFIAGQINSHLWQRQSSRSKCGVAAIYPGPSIMYGRTNIPDGVQSRI